MSTLPELAANCSGVSPDAPSSTFAPAASRRPAISCFPAATADFNAFTSAVAAGKQEIAGLLLAAGAKVEDGASGLTPLQFAASSGSVDMIRFLVKSGANVNRGAKSGQQTALLSAIYGAH